MQRSRNDVNVEDNVAINTAGNAGTVFDNQRRSWKLSGDRDYINHECMLPTRLLRPVVPSLVVQESANYTGDMQIGGGLSVTDNVIMLRGTNSWKPLDKQGLRRCPDHDCDYSS